MEGKGKFITLEGGEGVGKSTQLARLAEALEARGHSVVTSREPGGTEGAEAIRGLLMSGHEERWNARTEALLFAAARADHVAKVIRPALARGQWVLCDRYIDSTRAYQGGAGGVSDTEIMALHRFGSGGLLPFRTLLFFLPPEIGVVRAAQRGGCGDRMGSKGAAYYADVGARFESLATAEPERFRRVDAAAEIEVVTEACLAALGDIL